MDLLVHLLESTLTGSAPLTGDAEIRTHCGYGFEPSSNLELRTSMQPIFSDYNREFEVRLSGHRKQTGLRLSGRCI